MRKSIKFNAFLSVIKQLCAVVFPLITIPYVSRVLRAQNYGKVSFVNSLVSYFVLFAALGINDYAIREGSKVRNNKNKLKKFADEIYSINIISMTISYILLALISFCVKDLHEYKYLIVIQSLSILLNTLGADWINSIYEDYFYITLRYLFFQFISIILMFIFVKSTNDYISYAAITVFASSGGNILNIFYIRKYTNLRFTFKLNLNKHIKSIIYLFFNAIAVTIYVNSDMTILGIIRSETEVGIYGLSTKIYSVIKQILNAIVIVTLPRLSLLLGEHKLDSYDKLTKKIFEALITILFPSVVGVIMISKDIICIIGGQEYIIGYISLQILGVALIFAVISGFFCSCILLPYGKEKICLIASTVGAASNVLLNIFFIKNWGINGAAITTMLSEAIVMCIYAVECKKYITLKIERKVILSVLIGMVCIIIDCYIFKQLVKSIYVNTIVSIASSAVMYIIVQVILKNPVVINLNNEFINKMKKKYVM